MSAPMPTREEVMNLLPINHFSFSSMKTFMEDMNHFYKWYILWERDDIPVSPSYVIGSWVHLAIELLRDRWKQVFNDKRDDLKKMHKEDPEKAKKFWSTQWKMIAKEHWLENEMLVSMEVHVEDAEKKWVMEWWKTWDREKVVNDAKSARNWYLDCLPLYRPIHTEVEDIFDFFDADWNEMPLPVKAKIDLIAETIDWLLAVVDHKTVSPWYETPQWAIDPKFDLQSWTYYIGCYSVEWRKPDIMIFDQIYKKEMKPWTGLRQKDLRDLCTKNTIERGKYDKNTDLVKKLVDAWVLEAPKQVLPYVIDFTKTPRPINMFLKTYRTCVVLLYYMVKHDLPRICNPFKMFWAEQTYKDRMNITE